MIQTDRKSGKKDVSLPFSLTALSILLVLSTLISGCGKEREEVHRALYEWRSEITYTSTDLALLDSLKINKLYVRFFDVQWHEGNGDPYPESIAQFRTMLPEGIEIVPTVYVTNEMMRRAIDTFSPAELAANILRKVESMAREGGVDSGLIREIQLDCDWTESTQLTYFELLREVKKRKPEWKLSSTIRLHQIKYRVQTGIPPVDRGMVMAYNVGEVTSPEEKNSIFTEDEVAKYLGPLDEYPIPLDAALPIFAWGVRFHFDRFAAIIDNIGRRDMIGRPGFQQVGENLWQAVAHTELRGEPIYAGDIIRIEEPDKGEVLATARRIAGDIDEKDITLALYRFDSLIINRNEIDHLQNLYRAFD